MRGGVGAGPVGRVGSVSEDRYWSVTSLISAGTPKEALIGWAARVTAERAFDKVRVLNEFVQDGGRSEAVKWLTDARWEKSSSAAARGTSVHSIIEAYALGQTPVVPEEYEPWHRQIVAFLEQHQPEFEASEAPVYHRGLAFAGTLDSILRVDGVSCVVDAKTTDKTPDARSRPPYGEVALQLCAYSRCELMGLSPATMRKHGGRRYYVFDDALEYAPMPEVGGAFALVISPVDFQFVPVRIDDEVWRSFLAVREVARWNLDISKRVFGPTVTARAAA